MNAIFPAHICPWFKASKRQSWNARIRKSVSGVRRSFLFYSTPTWTFNLPLGVMEEGDQEILQGFVAYLGGGHGTFYFLDPTNKQEDITLGTGDGAETDFQLFRDWGYEELYREYPVFPSGVPLGYGLDGYLTEDITGYGVTVPPLPEVSLDGVLQTADYTLTTDGKVSFTTAPALNVVVTATFYMCYLAAFVEEPETSILFPGGWSSNLTIETVK